MQTLFRDFRFGARTESQSGVYCGGRDLPRAWHRRNTAVFSVINAVLLKSLPFKDPESLVLVSGDSRDDDRLRGRNQLSATDVADFRSQTTVTFPRDGPRKSIR